MFEIVENEPQSAVIKVLGVGGAGGNAVQHMVNQGIEGVDFICANTDAQALKNLDAPTILQLGDSLTKGLGAGANPEVGRRAAQEDGDRIAEVLEGSDMVFVTAGMGGGTGTGAAPVVAEIAREMGILTVAVVTKPFRFEKRSKVAEEGLAVLANYVDSLITIENEKLLSVLGGQVTMLNAFAAANDVLLGAVQGIADLIIRPGMINVDFADVRTVMAQTGLSMMGTGRGSGEGRARAAAEAAISSPLLEDVDLQGAKGILVNVTAGMDMGIGEFAEVGEIIEEFASDKATVVVGTVIDPEMEGEMKVTVVATGLAGAQAQQRIEEDTRSRVRAPGEPVDYDQPTVHRVRERVAPQNITRAHRQPSERPRPTAVEAGPTVTGPGHEAMGGARESSAGGRGGSGFDLLDVPAFLRRQAD